MVAKNGKTGQLAQPAKSKSRVCKPTPKTTGKKGAKSAIETFSRFGQFPAEIKIQIWESAFNNASPSAHFFSVFRPTTNTPEDVDPNPEEAEDINPYSCPQTVPSGWDLFLIGSDYELLDRQAIDEDGGLEALEESCAVVIKFNVNMNGGSGDLHHLLVQRLQPANQTSLECHQLRQVAYGARYASELILTRQTVRKLEPVWADLGSPSEQYAGPKNLVKLDTDLVCLQLPAFDVQRRDGADATPYRMFSSHHEDTGFFGAAYPAFMHLKKLCFEIPPLWKQAAVAAKLPFRARLDYLRLCYLTDQDSTLLADFPSLEELYFIDYEITLERPDRLSPSAERFDTADSDWKLVEVQRGNEDAWERGWEAETRSLARGRLRMLDDHEYAFDQTMSWIYEELESEEPVGSYPVMISRHPDYSVYEMTTRQDLAAHRQDAIGEGDEDRVKVIDYIQFALEKDKTRAKPVIKLLANVEKKILDGLG